MDKVGRWFRFEGGVLFYGCLLRREKKVACMVGRGRGKNIDRLNVSYIAG